MGKSNKSWIGPAGLLQAGRSIIGPENMGGRSPNELFIGQQADLIAA